MSVAMILMVWRAGMDLPPVGPMLFFLAAGIWFVCMAGRVSPVARDRLTNYYNAAMMAAMAWMYVAMTASLARPTDSSTDHAQSGSLAVNMSGMEMPAHEMMAGTLAGPGWMTTVNWIATLGFGVIALYWPCRYFAERQMNPAAHARLEPLNQAFTAAGTALMFGALL
jgi:hypothetical protein